MASRWGPGAERGAAGIGIGGSRSVAGGVADTGRAIGLTPMLPSDRCLPLVLALLPHVQPGSRQTFYCTSVNVGVISAVTVRTEDPSPGAKWGLATLEVRQGLEERGAGDSSRGGVRQGLKGGGLVTARGEGCAGGDG